MYVLLVKLQSIQNEDYNEKIGRFRRSVLRRSVLRRSVRFPNMSNVEKKHLLMLRRLQESL